MTDDFIVMGVSGSNSNSEFSFNRFLQARNIVVDMDIDYSSVNLNSGSWGDFDWKDGVANVFQVSSANFGALTLVIAFRIDSHTLVGCLRDQLLSGVDICFHVTENLLLSKVSLTTKIHWLNNNQKEECQSNFGIHFNLILLIRFEWTTHWLKMLVSTTPFIYFFSLDTFPFISLFEIY